MSWIDLIWLILPVAMSACWAIARADRRRQAAHLAEIADPCYFARRDYVAGRIDMAEFEERVEVALGLRSPPPANHLQVFATDLFASLGMPTEVALKRFESSFLPGPGGLPPAA